MNKKWTSFSCEKMGFVRIVFAVRLGNDLCHKKNIILDANCARLEINFCHSFSLDSRGFTPIIASTRWQFHWSHILTRCSTWRSEHLILHAEPLMLSRTRHHMWNRSVPFHGQQKASSPSVAVTGNRAFSFLFRLITKTLNLNTHTKWVFTCNRWWCARLFQICIGCSLHFARVQSILVKVPHALPHSSHTLSSNYKHKTIMAPVIWNQFSDGDCAKKRTSQCTCLLGAPSIQALAPLWRWFNVA